jgi:hypothetical protein
MKKIKLIIAAVAMLSLVSSSAVYAEGFAPGEGLYIGAFVGHSAGHVNAKTSTTQGGHTSGTAAPTTFDVEIKSGGVGLEGMEGGGYLGYGYKMGDLYIGFESDYAAGGAKFELTTGQDVDLGISSSEVYNTASKVDVDTQWTAGGGALIGYYVSPTTLLTFKGGIAASKFDVDIGTHSESYYGGGPRLGVAIASAIAAIDPNLSVRLSWDYTDYMTAPVNGIGTLTESKALTNSEVSGAMYNARLGIQYSFFDANNLF